MLIGAIQTDKVITESGKTEQGTLLKGGGVFSGGRVCLELFIVTKCLHNEEYTNIVETLGRKVHRNTLTKLHYKIVV